MRLFSRTVRVVVLARVDLHLRMLREVPLQVLSARCAHPGQRAARLRVPDLDTLVLPLAQLRHGERCAIRIAGTAALTFWL